MLPYTLTSYAASDIYIPDTVEASATQPYWGLRLFEVIPLTDTNSTPKNRPLRPAVHQVESENYTSPITPSTAYPPRSNRRQQLYRNREDYKHPTRTTCSAHVISGGDSDLEVLPNKKPASPHPEYPQSSETVRLTHFAKYFKLLSWTLAF